STISSGRNTRSRFVRCGLTLRTGSSCLHTFNDFVDYSRTQRECSDRDSGDDGCGKDGVEEEVRVEAQDPSCQVRSVSQRAEHGYWRIEAGHEDERVEDCAEPDDQC